MSNNNTVLTYFVFAMVLLVACQYLAFANYRQLQQPEPVEPVSLVVEPLQFDFTSGSSMGFWFEYQGSGEIDLSFVTSGDHKQAVEFSPLEHHSQGQLWLRFFALSAQRWQVAAQVNQFDFKINGQVHPFVDEISRPLTFVIEKSGQIGEFEFAQLVSVEAQSLVKSLLSQFSVRLQSALQPRWVVEEQDLYGRYVASYRRKATPFGTVLDKVKRQYHSNTAMTSVYGVADSQVKVAHSLSRYQLATGDNWLAAVTHKQNIDLVSGKRVWGWMSSQLDIERLSSEVPQHFAFTLEGHKRQMQAQYLAKLK